MAKKLSTQTIMQMLDLNQLTNVRSSPMNPAVSRSQTRNYTEGGNGAKFLAGDHIIVNLQTGTNWIDVLQSFLVFDVSCTGGVGLVRNSALSLFSECQVIADNRDVDRTRFLNVLNYRRVAQMSYNQKDSNYNSLFMANSFAAAEASEAAYNAKARGAIGADKQRVMIPLKFLGGIFDSYRLMPPHLARGLRIDLTCEAVNRALIIAFGQDAPTAYEITGVNILTDSYRMDTAILEYVNAEYASSKDGLIYEYFSYNSAKSTNAGDAINIEFNQSSSQTVDALVVQTLTGEKTTLATDSFKSAVLPAGVRSQWRIGSHYMPNQLTDGVVEHLQQYMYYLNGLRENKELAMSYTSFTGKVTGNGGFTWGIGDGAFAQTFQRSNMVEVSGMAVNQNSSLGFLAEGVTVNCDVYIFVRHLRRAVLFLQSMTLET